MKKIFVTYGDAGYEASKRKIINEASATDEFDFLYSYGRDDLSDVLLSSEIITVKRGGGLWSWKPDVILSTMLKHNEGDIIVYCDAGCSVYSSPEWRKIWEKLEKHDIIAQRIFQKSIKWTRREILDYFKDNGLYLADRTIIAKCNYFCYDGFLIKNAPYKFSINTSICTL